MKKLQGIFALSVILLFLGVTAAPVSARATVETSSISVSPSFGTYTEGEITALERFFPALMQDLTKVSTARELQQLVLKYSRLFGKNPLFNLLHSIAVRAVLFGDRLNNLRPLRTSAFVLSMGTMNRFLFGAKTRIALHVPIAMWFYTAKNDRLMDSRTIIIDFTPFSIKVVDGRQVGLMQDFLGLYIHRNRALSGDDHTFFFGHVGRIRALDLSPLS